MSTQGLHHLHGLHFSGSEVFIFGRLSNSSSSFLLLTASLPSLLQQLLGLHHLFIFAVIF
ncbi:unnamed protein product [Arabidopsis halleri]